MRKLLLSFVLGTSLIIQAQDTEEGHEGHHHHAFEIGVANAPVYFLNEKEISYGLHFHGIYTFPHSKYGVGLGFERIFDEHEHSTFSAVMSYRPIVPLSLIVSPGFTIEQEEMEQNTLFSFHFEVAYEYALGNFHLGPVAEIAYDPEDIHLSLGLHLGYGL